MTVTVLAECGPYITADASCRAGRSSRGRMTFFSPELSSAHDAGRDISPGSPSRWGWLWPRHDGHVKRQRSVCRRRRRRPGTPASRLGGSIHPGLRKLQFRLPHFMMRSSLSSRGPLPDGSHEASGARVWPRCVLTLRRALWGRGARQRECRRARGRRASPRYATLAHGFFRAEDNREEAKAGTAPCPSTSPPKQNRPWQRSPPPLSA